MNIKSIRKELRIKKPFTETELEMLRKESGSLRNRAIVEVLYSTGARVGEVCGMDIRDVEGDEAVVFGKGEKERTVYLNARARLALKEYLGSRKDNCTALFVGERSKRRLSKNAMERIVREIGARAGVTDCHPHRFRRTVATLALNRGMPIEQVQRMLGHEDIAITTIYAKSWEETVKANHMKYVV